MAMQIWMLWVACFPYWLRTASGFATSISSQRLRQQQRVTLRFTGSWRNFDCVYRYTLNASSPPDTDPVQNLMGMLSQIDKSWNIQRRFRPQSRWKILDVNESKVYLLEPPNSTIPSCIIIFFGGAGLGQFPHIAYNELLLRVSNRLNAAILAVPYGVSLDHFLLAKNVGEMARKALMMCEEERHYPIDLPVYCVAHSLGCKLATIFIAATQQKFDGIAFLSYNNFGFSRTISLARKFAETIGSTVPLDKDESNDSYSHLSFARRIHEDQAKQILNQVFDLAEATVSLIGIEFSPDPAAMNRLIFLKFRGSQQENTRLFAFDNDTLDSTDEFIEFCSVKKKDSSSLHNPSVSALPGTHLTPVFFKFDLVENVESMDKSLGESPEFVRDALGDYRSIAFGDEPQLDVLVMEVCDFFLGRKHTQEPQLHLRNSQ